MTTDPTPPAILVGLVTVREHCTFTWRRSESGGARSVEIRPDHCPQCVAELGRRGARLITPDGEPYRS